MSNKRTTVGVNIFLLDLEYIQKVYTKSLSSTLNLLVAHFRINNIPIGTSGRSGESKLMQFGVSQENLEFLNSVTVMSRSFTIACLVATARELDIKI